MYYFTQRGNNKTRENYKRNAEWAVGRSVVGRRLCLLTKQNARTRSIQPTTFCSRSRFSGEDTRCQLFAPLICKQLIGKFDAHSVRDVAIFFHASGDDCHQKLWDGWALLVQRRIKQREARKKCYCLLWYTPYFLELFCSRFLQTYHFPWSPYCEALNNNVLPLVYRLSDLWCVLKNGASQFKIVAIFSVSI